MTREAQNVKARVELAKAMDSYVRNVIGDDEITVNCWLAYGMPDDEDNIDLIYDMEDEDTFEEWVAAFKNCLYLARIKANCGNE